MVSEPSIYQFGTTMLTIGVGQEKFKGFLVKLMANHLSNGLATVAIVAAALIIGRNRLERNRKPFQCRQTIVSEGDDFESGKS